jgi:hypothetical protein
VAEWLYVLENKRVDFITKRGSHNYEIPHHPSVGSTFPERSHINWPVAQQYDETQGTHGKFDAFLYPLGNDIYSRIVLPSATSSSDQFDGIISVIVKMEFDFDITSSSDIHTWLNQADTRISRRFNGKYYATGSVSGRNYTRCLLNFSARYWVDDYSTKDPRVTSEHIEVRVRESGSSGWDSGIITNDYLLFFRRSHSAGTFATYFGNMIGLSDGTTTTPADFRSIARVVMPNADVHSI